MGKPVSIPNTCAHRKLDGAYCGCMALKDKRYCYFHERYNNRSLRDTKEGKAEFSLMPFDDTRTVIFNIYQLISELHTGEMDPKIYHEILYGLQVTATFANREDALSPDALARLEQQRQADAEAELEEEEEESVMAGILRNPLADYKVQSGPDAGRPAFEFIMDQVAKVDADAEKEQEMNSPGRVPLRNSMLLHYMCRYGTRCFSTKRRRPISALVAKRRHVLALPSPL